MRLSLSPHPQLSVIALSLLLLISAVWMYPVTKITLKWLYQRFEIGFVPTPKIQGEPASMIRDRFKKFEAELPDILKKIGYQADEPQYGDIIKIIGDWLKTIRLQINAQLKISGAAKPNFRQT
jgi:hypothetical protein